MPVNITHVNTVRVSTHTHGQFRLRHVMEADLMFLDRLGKSDEPASECVWKIFAHQLTDPQLTLEQAHDLPMPLLIHVVRVWLRRAHLTEVEQNATTGSAEGIKAAAATATTTFIKWVATSMRNSLAPLKAQMDEAEPAFASTGYGFANFLPFSYIVQIPHYNARTRNALVTHQLIAYLRSAQFEQELHDMFDRSPVLRRRWRSVMGGLRGHQQRDYQKSVLTWLREVEGTLKDLLVAMRRAKRVGETYYAVEYDELQNPKLGKRLEKIGHAVALANVDPTAALYKVMQSLTGVYRDDRNPISHGARYRYQSPKLSVQGLLMIRMLAEEIVRVEATA